MIDIKLIEARINELFTKGKDLNVEDEEKLFYGEIAPLVRLQRLYLREHGRIPQLNARYEKWKQRKGLEEKMDNIIEKQKEQKENREEGY